MFLVFVSKLCSIRVHGLIFVNLGVLDVKWFGWDGGLVSALWYVEFISVNIKKIYTLLLLLCMGHCCCSCSVKFN